MMPFLFFNLILTTLSYTCGVRWRKCACTEETERRRQEELATRQALIKEEEAEVQAAIKAVADAERRHQQEAEEEECLRSIAEQEEKKRIAKEEARRSKELQRLKRLETKRVSVINHYYNDLQVSLSQLHRIQRKAITARHSTEMRMTRKELENIATQEVELYDEQLTFKRAWEESLTVAQLRNAREIIDTSVRHRADQDKYFQKLAEPIDQVFINDITKSVKIEELTMLQEAERDALRKRYRRDMRKLQARAVDIQSKNRGERQAVLQQEKESVTQAIEDLQGRMVSDVKWLELLIHERNTMLSENRLRYVSSVAEAPTSSPAGLDLTDDLLQTDIEPSGLQKLQQERAWRKQGQNGLLSLRGFTLTD